MKQSPRRDRRDPVGAFDESRVGHQHDHDVLGGEIRTQRAGGLGGFVQFDEPCKRRRTKPLDLGRTRDVHRDEVSDPTITCLHRPEREVPGEPAPRVPIGQPDLDRVEMLDHAIGEHSSDQIATRWEPSIHRCIARASPLRDVIECGVESLLGEHLTRSVDNRRPVAGGISTKIHSQDRLRQVGRYPHLS